MHIVVCSKNPVKIGAVEDAFTAFYPDLDCTVEGLSVPSGVADQPMTDEETWRGARNRVSAAAEQRPKADYWIGLEGGVDTLHEQLSTFAWIYIERTDGSCSQSRSASMPLPEAIAALIDGGMELGHACDKVYNTENIKHKSGAIGLLTKGLYTRRSSYAQTACFALAGFATTGE